MSREALIVGISNYQRSPILDSLTAPANDAERVAQVLDQYGEFDKIRRFPETRNQPYRVCATSAVSRKGLKGAIADLFNPKGNQVADTALLYFSGHGLPEESGNVMEFNLATSDADEDDDNYGVSFSWLRKQLKNSPVRNQVVILDCCYSGGLIDLDELGTSKGGTGRYFIAACRDVEVAYTESGESVFTRALLEGLDPTRSAQGEVTGTELTSAINRSLKKEKIQIAKPYIVGTTIRLTVDRDFSQDGGARKTNSKNRTQRASGRSVPLQMPPLPDHFVERPEQQNAVKAELLSKSEKTGTLVVSAIYGLGGIGKSVLASKLAHDAEVQAWFVDGILWATLGQNPDILPLLSGWIQELGDYDYKPTAIESATNHLRTLLFDKQMLLVVDDVWNPAHLEPFRVGGKDSCVLVTTREARIPEARRYDLDVLDENQAIELMTQKLRKPLTEDARTRAEAFAARVGYLPLALELAASQIEEGVSWQELFEDLTAEVARLEGLDVYGKEEIPEDAKRRKYSLLACFNLSLKQLSAEQLQQFAWLGIVPEDVSLTQEMAETLWQVTSRQAGSILRTLRNKALVLQGAKQADGRASYRMHDLMHDLAQRLLRAPVVTEEGELPGLGLSKEEAHGELLRRYKVKTAAGQWHTLKDDGYIYAHLTWHMEQARQGDDVHALLQASNEAGRNGWYEACDAIGKPAGFVNDLGRAWQLAAASYEEAPGEAVALVWRYALIRGSLNSLASNIPAELVGALVEKGVWQSAQGLAYAQQAQNPWQRAKCIAAIAPYISTSLLPEAIKNISQIQDASYRSYALSKLAIQFPELWPDALRSVQEIQDRYGNHRYFVKGFSYRAFAVSEIVKDLPSEYLSEVINIADQILDAADQSEALIEIAKRVKKLWPRAILVIKRIKDDESRLESMIKTAKHIPEIWEEVLHLVRSIESEDKCSWALRNAAHHISPNLIDEAITTAEKALSEEMHQAWFLRDISENIPLNLRTRTIDAMRDMKDAKHRIIALSGMAKHTPNLWTEIIDTLKEIDSKADKATALWVIAEHIPPRLRSKILEEIRTIKDDNDLANALYRMTKHLPELWLETLEAIGRIGDEQGKTMILEDIRKEIPANLLPNSLEIVNEIDTRSYRARALGGLSTVLPVSLLQVALETTRSIKDEYARAIALYPFGDQLELRREALSIARSIKNNYEKASALSAFTTYMPDLWPEVICIVKLIRDNSQLFDIIREISEFLPVKYFPELFEIVKSIDDEYDRLWAAVEISEALPLQPLEELLGMAKTLKDESTKAYILASVVKNLPSELWLESLEIARDIKNDVFRTRALAALVQYFPELWLEVFEAAQLLTDEEDKATILGEVAKHVELDKLPEILKETLSMSDTGEKASVLITISERTSGSWDAVFEVIESIKNENHKAWNLANASYCIPVTLFPRVLEIAGNIKAENERSAILSRVSSLIPSELWPQTIQLIREFQDEDSQSIVLREISDYLPDSLWPKAFEVALSIQDKYYAARALQGFLGRLEGNRVSLPDWMNVLDILSYQDRSEMLDSLQDNEPIIVRLGGKETFSEVLKSVRDVCQQWP